MFRAIRAFIPILPLLLMAFSIAPDRPDSEIYYNNLQNLKNSAPPQAMKVVKIDNMANGKSMVVKGLLVTYKNRYAKSVLIAGDFSNWKFDMMDRGRYGVWYYLVDGDKLENDKRYKFFVDGIWISDPMNSVKMDDGNGSYVSVLNGMPEDEGRNITFRFIDDNTVEFRLYNPRARLISLVGDFNNWNPESDLLEKDRNGIWRLRKRLSGGSYRYKYIVDGRWVYDLFNDETASDGTGGICSLIKIR
ncbi:MAG: glycogen-binding domain-containing protein [Spirochaetes bacterium]|nr:glycogen-binding domain-containing protein [Spirochaetota bacterium]